MYNSYRKRWLIDRYGRTLTEVFGHRPVPRLGRRRQPARRAGRRARSADQRCARTWQASAAGAPAPATDDHPFPYLLKRGIPSYYLGVLLAVLLVRAGQRPRRRRAAAARCAPTPTCSSWAPRSCCWRRAT